MLKNNFWKIIGVVIALSLIAIAILIGVGFYKASHWENNRVLSKKIGYANSYKGGYIYDLETGEKLIPEIDWLVEPQGNDSIGIFHWGDKRGYFNVNTGEIVAQPKYDAAWMFRSGVGAVALNDSIFFIGLDGKPLNNKKFPREKGEDYLFNGEYCIIKIGDKYGAIDKTGEWVLPPNFDYIENTEENILVTWLKDSSTFYYRKDGNFDYPTLIETKGDTLYTYTDSIKVYIRDRRLEKGR